MIVVYDDIFVIYVKYSFEKTKKNLFPKII